MSHGEALAELQTWYLDALAPKLAAAANAGKVAPVDAAALDRRLRELLDLAGRRLTKRAA
jgi:uncharacterized protein YciW